MRAKILGVRKKYRQAKYRQSIISSLNNILSDIVYFQYQLLILEMNCYNSCYYYITILVVELMDASLRAISDLFVS